MQSVSKHAVAAGYTRCKKRLNPESISRKTTIHELHFSHRDRREMFAELKQLIQIKTVSYFKDSSGVKEKTSEDN